MFTVVYIAVTEEGNYTQSKAWETCDKLSSKSLFCDICCLLSTLWHMDPSETSGPKVQAAKELESIWTLSHLLPSDLGQAFFPL